MLVLEKIYPFENDYNVVVFIFFCKNVLEVHVFYLFVCFYHC